MSADRYKIDIGPVHLSEDARNDGIRLPSADAAIAWALWEALNFIGAHKTSGFATLRPDLDPFRRRSSLAVP